jgi:hypothetical protein
MPPVGRIHHQPPALDHLVHFDPALPMRRAATRPAGKTIRAKLQSTLMMAKTARLRSVTSDAGGQQ